MRTMMNMSIGCAFRNDEHVVHTEPTYTDIAVCQVTETTQNARGMMAMVIPLWATKQHLHHSTRKSSMWVTVRARKSEDVCVSAFLAFLCVCNDIRIVGVRLFITSAQILTHRKAQQNE